MFPLVEIFSVLWLARTLKFVLFWIFLWQLKEYHIGRFIDHFRTSKGKTLIFGGLSIIKLVLLILLLANESFLTLVFYILFAIYSLESLAFIYGIAKNTFKKPVATKKTIFLTSISFLLVIFYVFFTYNYNEVLGFTFSLLLFDIMTPLLVSAVVLLFQPFFVLARNSILKKAAKKIAQHKNLVVIGITGSYGKTSTKEFLTTILSSRPDGRGSPGAAKFNVLSTPEHKNSEIGIAQTILESLNEKHKIFIVEMGSYSKGGIKLLCDIVKPRIGIVTGVNEQHLATFGSLENLLSAEGGRELAQSLPKNGLLILNGDNKYCLDLYKKVKIHKKLYTVKKDTVDSDIWTEGVDVKKDSLHFIVLLRKISQGETIFSKTEMAHFDVSVLGKQNVQNLLGAILIAKELGMSLEEIAKACKNIKQEQAGMTLKKGVYGLQIIDSSYSSNPDGVVADLDYLNLFSQNLQSLDNFIQAKKVVVMPCLIELGSGSAEIHKQIGKKIAEVCDLAIITTQDNFEELKKGAVANGMAESKILLCDPAKLVRAELGQATPPSGGQGPLSGPTNQIFNIITTFCKEGDAVLLEGRVPSELIKLLKK